MSIKNFIIAVSYIAILCILPLSNGFSQETRPISEDGLVAFKVGDNWGIKDASGNEIVPAKYASIGKFSEEMATVNVGGKYRTVEQKFGPLSIPYQEFSGGKWGYINSRGEEILPCKYDDVKKFSEGIAAVKIKNSWFFINKSGEVVISGKYEAAESFSEGLAAVKIKNKFGYINKSGQLVIPCKYGEASNFSEGLAAVASFRSSEVKTKVENITKIYVGRKWGFIDTNGVVVIPLEYFSASSFENGKAQVTDFAENKFFINMQGKKIEN